MHVLRSTPVTISNTWYSDGEIADPGEGVTVAVVLPDGSTLEPAPNVTGSGAAPRNATILASATAELGVVTATWTSSALGVATTTFEVVGDVLFTIAEARAFDGGALSSATRYPTEVIEQARARITDWFQELCGVSFIPRGITTVLDGSGRDTLLLSDLRILRVRSVETRAGGTWTALSPEDLDDVQPGWGQLIRDVRGIWPSGRRNVRVRYEHGQIRRAALLTVRHDLVSTDLSARATQIVHQTGTEYLWTPGLRGSSVSLPEVHAILEKYDERVPGIA
jgi:hypothetical protein